MASIARRAATAVAAAAVGLAALSGCSSWAESHNYNAPAPSGQFNKVPQWVRLDSPYNYQTILRACDGGDGIYEMQDSTFPFVVAHDPACPQH